MSEQDSPFRDVDLVNSLIGVKESFQAPTVMKTVIMDKAKREKLFGRFLALETNLGYDWFRVYFEEDQANRSKLKQDFTPQSITELLAALAPADGTYFEPAAGTGGMAVSNWFNRRSKTPFWRYRPSAYYYQLEELGDAALPFLLFNLSIRGMNATVFHGDSLSRQCKQIYFVQNDHDDALAFSSINVMPHSQGVTKMFNVAEWTEPEIDHVESRELSGVVAEAVHQMIGGKKI